MITELNVIYSSEADVTTFNCFRVYLSTFLENIINLIYLK